jgi:transcriptional regulator with XRE-family HTH domain
VGRRKKVEKELLTSSDSSPEARGLRVRRIRNMANLTRQEMCDNTGININSLKGWEIGRYGGLTTQGAEKIISLVATQGVKCALDWLMYGIDKGPTVQTDTLNFNHEDVLEDEDASRSENEKIIEELALFTKHYPEASHFIVQDKGMIPFYYPGEHVAGVSMSGQKIDKAIGSNCIIKTEDGTILLRELRKGLEHNTYTLICLNTHEMQEPVLYNVKISSVAPVLLHRKKLIV